MTTFDIKTLSATAETSISTLGFLTWYSITETEVNRLDLENKLRDAGLNIAKYMPRHINAIDAFRRATSAVEKHRQEIGKNVHVNILVRDLRANKDEILRSIVIEQVDTKQARLRYKPREAILRFDKKTKAFEVQKPTLDPMVQQVVAEAELLFERAKNYYTSRHIREMVSGILHSMSPILVRPTGGVYFVSVANECMLSNLTQFIRSFGGCSEGWMIPLFNNQENKDLVRLKLKESLEGVLNNMVQGVKNPKTDNWHLGRLIQEGKNSMSAFTDYQQLLQDELDDMNAVLDAIKSQVLFISNKIAEEKAS